MIVFHTKSVRGLGEKYKNTIILQKAQTVCFTKQTQSTTLTKNYEKSLKLPLF